MKARVEPRQRRRPPSGAIKQAMQPRPNHRSDSISFADFQSNPGPPIRFMKESRRPVELVLEGETSLTVQETRAYRELTSRLEILETRESLREQMAAIDRGEGRSAEEALEEIRVKHGLPR
jgi:hypothetical protein